HSSIPLDLAAIVYHTLSLHDALPISSKLKTMLKRFIERPVLSTVISIIIVILGALGYSSLPVSLYPEIAPPTIQVTATYPGANRSEEHTSELQSRFDLVCRLLLEKNT